MGQGGGGGGSERGGLRCSSVPQTCVIYIYNKCNIDIHMHVLVGELLSFSFTQVCDDA